jgi:hypothetical protein
MNMLPVRTSITIGAFAVLSALMPHGVRPAQLVSTLTLIRPSAAPVIAPVIPKTLPPPPVMRGPQAIPNLDVPPGSLDAFYESFRNTVPPESCIMAIPQQQRTPLLPMCAACCRNASAMPATASS